MVGSPASSHLLVVFLRDQYCDCYSLIINSLNVSEEHTLSMFADASKLEEVVMHWREEPVFRGDIDRPEKWSGWNFMSSTKANENMYIWEEKNDLMPQGRPGDDYVESSFAEKATFGG